jgi:hypothetical protein
MADYPSTLPAPLLADYAVEPMDPVLRTTMESGIARRRRRFRAVPHDITASFIFVGNQMAVFLDFYSNTLNGGTATFAMRLDIGNGAQNYTQVSFKEPYKSKKLGPELWQVTTKLEVIK